jgi:hypothetical protein
VYGGDAAMLDLQVLVDDLMAVTEAWQHIDMNSISERGSI